MSGGVGASQNNNNRTKKFGTAQPKTAREKP